MEYIWYTLLSRTEYIDNTTPKTLFLQYEIWKKINGMEDESDNNSNANNKRKFDKVEDFF